MSNYSFKFLKFPKFFSSHGGYLCPSLQRLCKNSLFEPSLRGHKVLIPIQGNQNLQFISCWFRTNTLWTSTHMHILGKANTHQLRLISSWNKNEYSLQSKPLSLLLSLYVCVCVGKVSTTRVRENNTTFELLHKERVWFGLHNNVPHLNDPGFKAGSYFDVTESIYKTGCH